MAVNGVKLLTNERGRRDERIGEERWEYLVSVSSPTDTPHAAMTASFGGVSIPALYAVHPQFADLVCRAKSAERDEEDWSTYYVTVVWGSVEVVLEPKPEGTNVKWNVDVSVSGVPVQEVVYRDRNGAAILNTAGQAFENQPTRTYYDEELKISFFTDAPAAAALKAARGKVNSATINLAWAGWTAQYTARQLKLTEAAYSVVYQEGAAYWKVDLTFQARSETAGYVTNILNQGYYELQTANLVPIKDSDNQPITTPALLDANGVKTTTPYYLTFEIEPEADLAALLDGTGIVSTP